jgi:hypothetical protein
MDEVKVIGPDNFIDFLKAKISTSKVV